MNGPSLNGSSGLPVWFFLFALAAAAAVVLVWRLNQFALLEPIIDQAFHIQWIKRIRLADHFLPQAVAGKGWIGALMADEQSALNIYLRQVYAAQQHIFTFVSVWWFVLWSFVLGISLDAQVAISIVTSVLALCVLSLTPLALRGPGMLDLSPLQAIAVGCGIFVLASTSSFLNDFSATGPHNSGVLFLLLAVIATVRWLAAGAFDAGWRKTLVMALAQSVAIYSFYTNVLLLPVATALAIIFSGARSKSWRLATFARYSAFVVAVCSPALLLLTVGLSGVVAPPSAASFFDVGQEVAVSWEVVFSKIGDRAGHWFTANAALFSTGGLILGLSGLAAMGLAGKVSLPMWVIVSHWGWTVALKGFGFFHKTSGYLVPLLCLGMAWVTLKAFGYFLRRYQGEMRWRRQFSGVAALLSLAFLAEHASSEGPRFLRLPHSRIMGDFVHRGPLYRSVVAEVEARMPAGAVLVPWDDFLGHEFWTYGRRIGIDIAMSRPLANLFNEYRNGTLQAYIGIRGLSLDDRRDIFLWVPERIAAEEFPMVPDAVFGAEGFGLDGPVTIEKTGSWLLSRGGRPGEATALYRLRRQHPWK